MRTKALLITLLGLMASPSADAAPAWGGYGHMINGFIIGDLSGLDTAVSTLGPASAPGYLQMIGGGGRTLLAGRVLLGGRGFGLMHGIDTAGEGGSASLSGGGGGMDIGVVFPKTDFYLMYPYVGGGGLGMTAAIQNDLAEDALLEFGGELLEPGLTYRYYSGTWYLDFGLGMQRLLFKPDDKGGGGFIIGGELGLMVGVGGSTWQNAQGVEVPALDPMSLTGFYTRLTFGGGGFFFD